MIFLLLIAILLLNCITLKYNFIPLVVNVIINNTVLYLNFIQFFLSIVNQKKKYGVNKGVVTIASIIPFIFITLYFFIRKSQLLSKPFSDFFGSYVIESNLNSLLNKTKKTEGYVFRTLKGIASVFYSFESVPKYIEPPNEKDYDNNWKTFINSIPFNSNGITQKTNIIYEKQEDIKTNLELENMKTGGGKNESLVEKILDFFFDFYVKKNTTIIKDILKKSNLYVEQDNIINLLDRKFLISKIIWLILIIIITQGIYMVLIIRDK